MVKSGQAKETSLLKAQVVQIDDSFQDLKTKQKSSLTKEQKQKLITLDMFR